MRLILLRSAIALLALACPAWPLQAQEPEPPRLRDPRAAAQHLRRNYPEDLRLLGIGGTVRVSVRLNREGTVDSVQVTSGSGIPSLDRAARNAARGLEFTRPANAISVEVPLTFESDHAQAAPLSELPQLVNRPAAQAAAGARLAEAARRESIEVTVPVVLAIDSAGKVVQARTVRTNCTITFDMAALAGAHTMTFAPATKPAAQPRHTVATFEFFIDGQGRVVRRRIKESSSICALDRAALEVAQLMRFRPVLLNGKPTRAWVDMPIIFRSQ
jgi:TonB family protein